jgi:hypothetical protein
MIAAVLAAAAAAAAPAFPPPPGLQDTPENRDWLARNVEVGDWLPYGVTGNAFVFFKPAPTPPGAENLKLWVRHEYVRSPTEDGKIGSTLMQFETDCTRKLIRNLTFVAYGRTNFRDLVQFVEKPDDWRQAGRFSSVGQALEWACGSEAAYRAVPWPAVSVRPTGEIVTDHAAARDTGPDGLRTVTQKPTGEIVTVLRSGAVHTHTLNRPAQ